MQGWAEGVAGSCWGGAYKCSRVVSSALGPPPAHPLAPPPPKRPPALRRRAAGLCGPQTVVLVSFELRSSKVKDTFLRESSKAFSRVERLSKAALPKCYQVEHIELYKLQL